MVKASTAKQRLITDTSNFASSTNLPLGCKTGDVSQVRSGLRSRYRGLCHFGTVRMVAVPSFTVIV